MLDYPQIQTVSKHRDYENQISIDLPFVFWTRLSQPYAQKEGLRRPIRCFHLGLCLRYYLQEVELILGHRSYVIIMIMLLWALSNLGQRWTNYRVFFAVSFRSKRFFIRRQRAPLFVTNTLVSCYYIPFPPRSPIDIPCQPFMIPKMSFTVFLYCQSSMVCLCRFHNSQQRVLES